MSAPPQPWRDEPAGELGLLDLWLSLKPYRGWIAGAAFATALVALGVSMSSARIWQASATVVPAFLAQPGQATGQPVEPIARSVERLQGRGFGDAVLKASGLSTGEDDPEARLFRKSLKVTQPIVTDFIRISVQARSPGSAARLLRAMLDNLRAVENDLVNPSIVRLRQDLANVSSQIESAKIERDRLERLRDAEKTLVPASRFSESVHLGVLIASKIAELEALELRRLQIEESLSPAKSHGVLTINDVYIDPRPVSPKPLRNSLIGALLGLCAAIVIALVRDAVKARAAARAAGEPVLSAASSPEERPLRERGL